MVAELIRLKKFDVENYNFRSEYTLRYGCPTHDTLASMYNRI